MPMNLTNDNYLICEYVWIDAVNGVRSKTRIFFVNVDNVKPIIGEDGLPNWNFDGSSTQQAEGHNSDVYLKPRSIFMDPNRRHLSKNSILVLCDLWNKDGTLHTDNKRVKCIEVHERTKEHEVLLGVEQEYIVYDAATGNPYGWISDNVPNIIHPVQTGASYCAVGGDRSFIRKIQEEHLEACMYAGLHIRGINTEVTPSQGEFQIGELNPVDLGDELWMARYLLNRVCEHHNCYVRFDPKPMKEWNGSGAHTNFSTKQIRLEKSSIGPAVLEACDRLKKKHAEHMNVYGDPERNKLRMTGKHETASFDIFSFGESDRGASVRLQDGRPYFEDRRPSSEMDPYVVATRMIQTICLNE